jgi:tRNA A37 threonylcarbamoyladenosine dehydratase
MKAFERRDILLNETQIEKLEKAKIAIFGLGGVGGYAFEALLRMGIKDFILCDGDNFTLSNLNRQILSTSANLNKNKAEEAKIRALSIFNDLNIKVIPYNVNKENINSLGLNGYYIVDCIDSVDDKIALIKYAKENGNDIISMMGAGNRLHASFISSDIYKTSSDALSKKMRKRLREESIDNLKVVYTKDDALVHPKGNVASISYVVGSAGLKVAEEVIKSIIE